MKFKRIDHTWANGSPIISYRAILDSDFYGLTFVADVRGMHIRTPYPGGAPLIQSSADAFDIAEMVGFAGMQHEQLKRFGEGFDRGNDPKCVLRETENPSK